jgi:uncharacterized protein YjbI with pentapeptide repeats
MTGAAMSEESFGTRARPSVRRSATVKRARAGRAPSATGETLSGLSSSPGTLPAAGDTVRLARADVERLLAAAAGAPLDLRGADLRGVDLSDLDLAQADLRGARLMGTRLIATDLERARLDEADLDGADLRGAILTGAQLDDANLSGAHLEGASLQSAYLVRAHLAHARLDGAHLRAARLTEATLWGASLRGAELESGHFDGADLTDAELDGAFFAGSMLADADLAAVRWSPLRAGEELVAEQATLAERPESFRAAADAYRRLRQACAAQGLYDRAGELYRREMRMRQRALGCEAFLALLHTPLLGRATRTALIVGLLLALPLRWLAGRLTRLLPASWRARPAPRAGPSALRRLGRLWSAVVRWLWHLALEALCGYGERVGRVLIAGALVVLGAALLYLRLGQLTEQDGTTVTSFWHALYFSVCSFSSIGYAAFAPNAHGLAKWLGVGESLTGNFLLALFLVTFTRKLTR